MDSLFPHKKNCWPELNRMISLVKELSLSKDISEIGKIVIREARAITNSDASTFVLKEKDKCYFQDEDSIAPLVKGSKLPLHNCICGWAIEHGEVVFVKDVCNDPRLPKEQYCETYVKSLLVVPIFPLDTIGAIGNYWANEYSPKDEDIQLLQALANVAAIAIEKVRLQTNLEAIVKERTAQLEHEIVERIKAQDALLQQSLTDSLTGLLNRRGFFFQVEQELKLLHRVKTQGALMFADVDGLKHVNDNYGHAEGDQMIINSANILRGIFRSSDVLARLGGDEFAAFTLDGNDLHKIRARIDAAIEKFNYENDLPYSLSVSVGLIGLNPKEKISLDNLLKQADTAMYEDKQIKKSKNINIDINPDNNNLLRH